MESIIKKLKELKNNDELTPKEKLLSNFILNNTQKAAELNMENLADLSETSTGTILRLTQKKLNLQGFSEFKQRLIKEVSQSQTIPNININDIKKEDNPYQYMLKKITEISQKNIFKLIEESAYGTDNFYLNEIYNEYLEKSEEIVVFDYHNSFGFSLSKLLSKQNYLNYYESSIHQCQNLINQLENNIIRKKRVLKNNFKDHFDSFKMIDFSPLFEKETFLNNLLIITAIEEYNDQIENLAKNAKNNDFKVILFHSQDSKNKIDTQLFDLKINLGSNINFENFGYTDMTIAPHLFLNGMSLYFQDNIKD
ncbi:MurR/RpiR family transcriptional regulator [Halanaerobium sp. ST460_2HS_T2]|uniref:MurR/RpiR family transcriptional regulator n=1 Tax=Halanaerobium sp. ST460_2HS_T2 TaxID=2183914 RepID=UPI000E034B73|nr:MurR/RpiR family transcriptional regulator [Halanaerobium sp. ST460_2HS_T2]RCW52485.1 RpiR family transcriptional regulator [Halanaerobium sp. ST460_2HS_T2]